jgi:hypothetical protein
VKGNFVFVMLAFALSKPQVTGDVSLGLASLNRNNLPIVVTLGGEGSCFASLIHYSLAFLLSTNCAITHTKINVTHLEIFTAKIKAVLHSNTHEIVHGYFWST